MKKYNVLFIYYLLSFIYFEIIFKLLLHNISINLNIIITLIFTILFSLILSLITKLFNEKINKIIFYVSLIFNFFWFSASYVLKDFFGFYLTLSTFNLADQIANGFTGDAVNVVFAKMGAILLLCIPLIIAIILRKKINFEKIKLKKVLVYTSCIIICTISYF